MTPTDGPATSFQPDPMTTTNEEVFGLVLVAAWPPPKALVEAYTNVILPQIRNCFDTVDHSSSTNDGEPPALYQYLPECLHVTIATPHSIAIGTDDLEEQANLTRFWKMVVNGAVQRPDWPKRTDCMQLSLHSCQIGNKAGIMLWKETTGTIDTMRKCLAQEVALRETEETSGVPVDSLQIPNIIHSTFLRYRHEPKTLGEVVQSRFRKTQDKILESFPKIITVPCSVKLVCERRPYMNIPDDADHVIASSI